jgi:phosphoribosylanthranilate isomerase
MRVKICGLTNVDDALATARAGADFAGLILAPSVRQVQLEVAREIVCLLPPPLQPVLVFRDTAVEEVLAAAAATGAYWVQLHGHEPVAYLQALLAQRPDLRIIKAWEVAAPADGDTLLTFIDNSRAAGVCPAVALLDVPKGGPHPGADCLTAVARRVATRPPEVWCAGGLTPATVATVVASGAFDGADVASGVETEPGRKDRAALSAFVRAVRAAGTRH